MDLQLTGKTALITGGSQGIGLACAQGLAAEGVHLHLAARTAADLEAAKAGIQRQHNVSVTTHAVDLSSGDVCRSLATTCKDIDILVNNAGAIPRGDLWMVDEATWRKAWDLKVFGYINLTRAVWPNMKAKGGGVIVNIIGLGGDRVNPGYIAGAGGNAAVMGFTRAMGAQGLDDKIRVVGLNMAGVRTARMERALKTQAKMQLGDESRWEELIQKRPPPGTPEEIANLAVFCASPRASHINATVLTIDGGVSVLR
ncbi:MAG: SDR family NAD(P)-dependent oxidoreductase [Alphaproteobacteria bacterium]|nr:SDR family NAD(P)-dependent oxidoreductase [Alphaproteobacteria bacterium]